MVCFCLRVCFSLRRPLLIIGGWGPAEGRVLLNSFVQIYILVRLNALASPELARRRATANDDTPRRGVSLFNSRFTINLPAAAFPPSRLSQVRARSTRPSAWRRFTIHNFPSSQLCFCAKALSFTLTFTSVLPCFSKQIFVSIFEGAGKRRKRGSGMSSAGRGEKAEKGGLVCRVRGGQVRVREGKRGAVTSVANRKKVAQTFESGNLFLCVGARDIGIW